MIFEGCEKRGGVCDCGDRPCAVGGIPDIEGVPPDGFQATPSGIEIAYWAARKKPRIFRQYQIRHNEGPVQVDGDHHEDSATAWQQVPSVSSISDLVSDPGGLIWWAMTVGVAGALQLFNQGMLMPAEVNIAGRRQLVLAEKKAELPSVVGPQEIVSLLQQAQLTTSDVRDTAGKRGQSAHDAFEIWRETGELPNPSLYPASEEGYVLGLRRALEDLAMTPLRGEVMVASIEHKYAGRYDLEARIDEPRQVVAHHTPARGPQHTEVQPGTGLLDLKTSKYVMPDHAFQLEGYEICRVECGYDPTDFRAVVHVTEDGKYRFVRTDQWARPEGFLLLRQIAGEVQEMKTRKPPGGRS